ncbi:MAG: type II toxin-antitoxin system VapC family toxin [Gammaproteobacteria bacterium]
MKYLLDTCVISDFIKGDPGTLNTLKATSPSEIGVASVTVMELQYGLFLHPVKAKIIRPIITNFLASIVIFDFDKNDAQHAAEVRAELKHKGQPIGPYDILLAGMALNRNLILVSANISEFKRIEKLKLVNWR